MIRQITRFVTLIFLLLLTSHSNAMTSVDITAHTVKGVPKCLRYKVPTRFCLWVSVDAGVPTYTVTPILDHYLPDLVVTIYRNKGENLWFEAKQLDEVSGAAQEAVISNVGSGNHSFMSPRDQQVIFKEADVIGNPGLLLAPKFGKILLESTATSFKPYFQSMLDSLLWRGFPPAALIEEGEAVGLGLFHHVGTGITDWGSVYPHEGRVLAMDDAKGSMVIAERATDLVTQTDKDVFGHVRFQLSNDCGKHCKASSITENSEETLFQRIYPSPEDDCNVLGSDESYTSNMLNQGGAYVWIVWRHYHGCPDGGDQFVSEVL
jgi:integrating conjugative element protein (TIGR03756 family)